MKCALVVAMYSAAMIVWFYFVLDPNIDRAPFGSYVAIGALHFAVGLVVRRWAIMAVVVLPPVIAAPAGYPGYDFPDPFPLWVMALGYSPVWASLIGLGVLTGRWRKRRRARPVQRPGGGASPP